MLEIRIQETRVYREAQEEKAKAIALKMLRKNVPLETIAEFTGVPIDQLQQLQADPP